MKNDSNLYLYIDGALNISLTDITTGDTTNTSNLFIGKRGEKGYENFFTGVIDELRIYNRALSEAEIQALYDYTPDSNSPPAIPSSPHRNTRYGAIS